MERGAERIRPPEHLAFAGCGVRNAAYAGALLELEQAGLLREITSYAGTSAGSIVATLSAVGYTPEEVLQHILDLDFTRLLDGNLFTGIWGLFTSYGWHAARYLEERLDELIAARLGRAGATFEDLRRAGRPELRILATNLSRSRARVFPDARSLALPISRAVRASMSIPLVFRAVRLEGELYVDGGVTANFPLGIFDAGADDVPLTLGCSIRAQSAEPRERITGLRSYVHALFAGFADAQLEDERLRPVDRQRWIEIGDLGIRSTEFHITREQKLALAEEGRRCARAFLARRSTDPAERG